MSKFKIGYRVEYVVDVVGEDTGTVTRICNWDAGYGDG